MGSNTFGALSIGDRFSFAQDDAGYLTKVSDATARGVGTYGYNRTVDAGCIVYNVKTAAQAEAEFKERCAREDAEKAERIKAFRLFAGQVAEALGFELVPDTAPEHMGDNRRQYLKGHGVQIALHGPRYNHKKKLAAYGILPDGHTFGDIYMSETKTPEQVAKDIMRRLVPGLIAKTKEAAEKKRAAEEYAAQVKALQAKVAEVAGARFSSSSESISIYAGSDNDRWYGSARVNGPDSVTIELRSLSPAIALKVLRLVMGK